MNWLSLALPAGVAAVDDLKRLCSATKPEAPKRGSLLALVQMLPALVVLPPVFKGIAFEALQFRRCMQRRFLLSAC